MRFISIWILSLFLFSFQQPNSISWTNSSKLKWSDFMKKDTLNNPSELAVTKIKIEINANKGSKEIVFDVTCCFLKDKSWTFTKDSLILIHEQGHFDLAEVATRNLRKELTLVNWKEEPDTKKRVNELYHKSIQFLIGLEKKYDDETEHSKNKTKQSMWNQRIEEMLTNFDLYSKRKVSIKVN